MTNTLSSVLERHRERSQGFALVAPLGGGAMLALQALQQTEDGAPSRPAAPREARPSTAAIGVLAALAICLGLAGTSCQDRDAAAGGIRSEAAVAAGAAGRTLRPITAGMPRPPRAESSDRDMQPTTFSPATMAIVPPAGPRLGLDDVVIDVIVAYTKAAASHYANIEREVIAPAIETGNASFRLSGIGQVKLRLVHAYQTDYVESGDQFVHLWRFADKADGQMDEIHELRDRYRADVAILVVDDADGCGQATRVQADEDEAFAVVHHACANANFSLVHEIGHLIGASHEQGYVYGSEWRDIMSYKANCGGCPRLPVWSNPDVTVRGVPAGSPGHDNARVIADNALRVAAFR